MISVVSRPLRSLDEAIRRSLPVPTALPADSFFLKILLRLSEAKGSTCTMSKGESSWTVSITWLMVSMTPCPWWGRRGRAGEGAEAVHLIGSLG